MGDEDGKLLIIACGALAREILAIIKMNRWQHVELQCLPADLHLYPDKIPAEVKAAVEKYRDEYQRIFIAYADCGTGGLLEETCNSLGVELIRGPHCYSFFEGFDVFAENSKDEVTAFYLTDFLTRQFDAFVWRSMGLDKHPQLLSTYFGNYEKLVYLAQTDDDALDQKAREAAERLGLKYERRFTGYGELVDALESANS